MIFADKITTVSPSYAEEIMTAEQGFGLEGVLQQRAADLVGIFREGAGSQWDPEIVAALEAVAPVDGRIGTETMPGVFAQVGMGYLHQYGDVPNAFELFAKISEKNHAHSTLNPLAAYTKKMTLEEIMGDMMIAYPNTRPMCLGLPMIGPSPSMQRMPSTIAMVLGSEALMSKTVCGIPAWCSTFFGQPYLMPGIVPYRFFIEAVKPMHNGDMATWDQETYDALQAIQ